MKRSIGSKTPIIIASSLWLLIALVTSLHLVTGSMTPVLHDNISDRYLASLPSPFPPLTDEEKQSAWGIEYLIGKKFAKKLDLYRAITAFERSLFLASDNHTRQLETDYQIVLSYYVGKRYKEIDQFLATSPLAQTDDRFPAFSDLLILLFDTKWCLGEKEKAYQILELIGTRDRPTYEALLIGLLMREGELEKLKPLGIGGLDAYFATAKSSKKASLFSALIPGAGYLYLGQVQTAITGFLLNILFACATIAFFKRGLIALGLLFLSFEIGWYAGGIDGSFRQATTFNQKAFEAVVTPIMHREKYFPIYRIRHAF